METLSGTTVTNRPSFSITRADGSNVTVQGSSLADALRRYYNDKRPWDVNVVVDRNTAVVVAITRVDDSQRVPDTGFVFGLTVFEVEDIRADLAAALIQDEIVPTVSVDADGSNWAFRVLVEGLPADAPPHLRTQVAQEFDGIWNLAYGSLDQMNKIARDWIARQEELHPGLVIVGP